MWIAKYQSLCALGMGHGTFGHRGHLYGQQVHG